MNAVPQTPQARAFFLKKKCVNQMLFRVALVLFNKKKRVNQMLFRAALFVALCKKEAVARHGML